MKLKDIKPSISEMDDEAVMTVIIRTRRSRLTPKKKKGSTIKNPGQVVLSFGASLEEDRLKGFIDKLEELR